MGLRQVDRRGADLLPQERDRIQPDDLHAIIHMQADDPQKLKQHLGVAEIKVDLVMAESAPDMARAA